MKHKTIMVAIAIFLGLTAVFMIISYTSGIKAKVSNEQELVKVLVAKDDIPEGLNIKDTIKEKRVVFEDIPKKYVASNAVTSLKSIDGQVIAKPLSEQQQITTDYLQYNSKAGLSFVIPDDHLAISIPVDEVKGVSGMIKAGDLVTVIATFSNTKSPMGSNDLTKILLQNVRIIAVGDIIAPQKGRAEEEKSVSTKTNLGQAVKQTVTLSLSPADAEKLVFAEEKGSVWLSLHTAKETEKVKTSGQTIETIFK